MEEERTTMDTPVISPTEYRFVDRAAERQGLGSEFVKRVADGDASDDEAADVGLSANDVKAIREQFSLSKS